MPLEYLIRNSDNQIKLTLTEDGIPISGIWTELSIHFGGIALTRTVDGDGITLSSTTGLLTISPGDLTALEKTAIDALTVTRSYSVEIVVTSTLNDDGAVFGGAGAGQIWFEIGDKPS